MSEPTTQPPQAASNRRHKPPFWLVAGALIVVVASWVPLAMIAKARYSTTTEPRIQIFQDMGKQPKYAPQAPSEVFADGRADRPRILSTVPRGHLEEDDHYYRGYAQRISAQTGKWDVTFFEGFPSQVRIDESLLARGRERFDIYCATCHGIDGHGNGPVNQRAQELSRAGQARWVQATDLHSDQVRDRANGHLFNTISNGIRTMPAYGGQIEPADRWAIVAYLRALQFSQRAPARVVPPQQLQTFR